MVGNLRIARRSSVLQTDALLTKLNAHYRFKGYALHGVYRLFGLRNFTPIQELRSFIQLYGVPSRI